MNLALSGRFAGVARRHVANLTGPVRPSRIPAV